MSEMDELVNCGNLAIADAALKCEAVFATHEKAYVSVSGGADSDVMVDLCERVRKTQPMNIHYEFTDTGIEYKATKEHLAYLEDRYGIKIRIAPPDRTIPQCAKLYGQPFVSKMASSHISKLQKGGFGWEDWPLDRLEDRYPSVPKSTLMWWTDAYAKNGKPNSYCINHRRHLRDFMVENHPWFPISKKCCDHAKKTPGMRSARVRKCDVTMTGVRRAEGGVRAVANSCMGKRHGVDTYKPLYWLNDQDRAQYDEYFDIRHSDCYAWGFKRTGCVGCPYSYEVFETLEIAEAHEPGVVRAARTMFRDALEYTRMFNEFREELDAKH